MLAVLWEAALSIPWSLRAQFYKPLRQALVFTNTEFGLFTTAYGVAEMLSYFLGGWLADRFSARKLLTISFVLTGFGGLYYATYPPLHMSIALHFFWGVTTVLTYWAALMKATRLLGSATEQGKVFGFLALNFINLQRGILLHGEKTKSMGYDK